MLVLQSNITIGNFAFDFVTDVEVSKSVDELTSGGYIDIPRNIVFRQDNQIVQNIVEGDDPLFKRGDAVRIRLGYAPRDREYFRGFVSLIRPDFPLRFEIEDGMFALKQHPVAPLNLDKTTLRNLLTTILPSTVQFEAIDIDLGNFRIKNPSTAAVVLDYLKSNYGLSVYFRDDGVLNVGFAFDTEGIETEGAPIFQFGRNIINQDNLFYQRAEDVKIKLNAISILPDNTKIELPPLGDEDGEQRTIYQYNMDEASLRRFANEELGRLKYEGFRGSFLAFLEPQVTAGQAVEIRNTAFPEKNGFYLVRAVDISFGQGGGRQEIELDKRIL